MKDLIRFRDQTCRIPYCDAAVRHVDHLTRWADGGRTRYADLGGVCEAHNYVHEHPDWHHQVTSAGPEHIPRQRHTFTVTTPTGHVHRTTAPAPPGTSV